jgi:hypothetical protein
VAQDVEQQELPSSLSEPGSWREILDFERHWTGQSAAKGPAIRVRFAVSTTRYHQLLNRLLDLPEALEYDPMLVHRLRRLRQARRDKRYARRLGLEA